MQEAELVQSLKAGSPAAQEALVQAYQRRLLATAWHVLGHRDPDAEDAVQETFMAAFKGIAGFEGRSGLYTWLNHICVNQCFSQVRKRKRLVATEAQDLEALMKPSGDDASKAVDEDQRRTLMLGWIKSLEARCSEILSLRFLDGLALAQIKDRLKVPLGTVASRLRRCQLALHERARKP